MFDALPSEQAHATAFSGGSEAQLEEVVESSDADSGRSRNAISTFRGSLPFGVGVRYPFTVVLCQPASISISANMDAALAVAAAESRTDNIPMILGASERVCQHVDASKHEYTCKSLFDDGEYSWIPCKPVRRQAPNAKRSGRLWCNDQTITR
jgi:hypothetical protein